VTLLLLKVVEVVAPVFLLGAIGFVWVKLGLEYRMQFVTRLAMTLGVPCLIFVSLMQTEIEPAALTTISVAALVAYGVVGAASLVLTLAARLEIRTYLSPLVFGNTGNLGLPIALFAFGDEGLGYAVVVFAVMAVLSFTIGLWLVTGGGNLLKVLHEPLLGATLLGALFLWQGWRTPTFLTNTLVLVGQLAIPLMLITLGVAISRLQARAIGFALAISLVKLGICLAVPVAVGLWFGLPHTAFAVLVIQISTPVAVTSYLLAEKYRARADEVAGLVVVSTLLSLLTIPVTLAFFV
jgi:malate permease and related proteins